MKYGVSELLHINHISNIPDITDIEGDTIRLKRESIHGIENIRTKTPISLSFKGYSLKYENLSLMGLKREKKNNITIHYIGENINKLKSKYTVESIEQKLSQAVYYDYARIIFGCGRGLYRVDAWNCSKKLLKNIMRK